MNWTLARIRPARRRLRLEPLEPRQLLASVSGVAYRDLDSSGTRDAGEPSLGGWTTYLDVDNNRQLDAGEPTSVTTFDDLDTPGVDEGGLYSFDSLPAGDYVVRMAERPLWQATSPLEGNPDFGKLAFAESLVNNQRDAAFQQIEGLIEPIASIVSPSGTDLYVASDANSSDAGVQHFKRDLTTGQLSFVRTYLQGSDDGHGNTINGVGSPKGIMMAPDGRFVYVHSDVANSLAIFARASITGQLTFVEFLRDGGTDAEGNTTSLLGGLHAATISADGAFLYAAAAGFGDKGLNVFSRDASSGRLTLVQSIPDDASIHLSGLSDVAISADGNFLYTASSVDSSIALFARNPTTGELLLVNEILDTQIPELTEVNRLAVSSDNKHLYATSLADDAIVVFDRNTSTGELSFVEAVIHSQSDSAGNPITHLLDPSDITLSPDGEYLFATAVGNFFLESDGLSVFQRNSTTGELTLLRVQESEGTDELGTTIVGQDGPRSVFVMESGESIFVTAKFRDPTSFQSNGSLVAYDREHLTNRPAGHSMSLSAAEVATGNDFGFVSITGGIVGTKWHDLNRNGQRDFGEPGIAGWNIYLDFNQNGMRDPGEPATQTTPDDPSTSTIDETGYYRFDGLLPGEYTVAEDLLERWEQIFPVGNASHSVVVETGLPQASFDFGNKRMEDLFGTKWFDENGNGIRDIELSIGSEADIVFAVDVSASATQPYTGEFVGDQNGDGIANSELDAAIESYKAINQRLIELGLGSSAEVSIVIYASTAEHLDMNPLAGGVQLSISPATDNNANGRPDVEEQLESIIALAPGLGRLTNYEAALREAAGLFTSIGTANGDGVVYLVTASPPTTGGSFLGEVRDFEASGVELRPIGLGTSAPLHELRKIDSNVASATSTAGVLEAAQLDLKAEPGLADWTIYLDQNNNGQLDPGEPSTLTATDDPATPLIDETGNYEFLDVGIGTYNIRELQQFGYQQTYPSASGHQITLAVGEFAESIDFGNEAVPVGTLSGTMWIDANNNGVMDNGEEGHTGQTIYLDANNNAQLDAGEFTTVTSASGSYTFTNVAAGTHIIREVVPSGFAQTYPNQLVVLDPDGTNNPPLGNVVPELIDLNLLPSQSATRTVQLTLPTDSVPPKVDILFQMDASQSFEYLINPLKDAYLQLIEDIQLQLPEIDLAFGVARHEDYGGAAAGPITFNGAEKSQRPFILSQPIITPDTPDFLEAIEEGILRHTPGNGGDNDESVFEGLFQAATGRGFDGNGDDDLIKSGIAGPADTQTSPGNSGDVPPFSSFQSDPDNLVLPPAGDIGGVGFRSGALPIILLANDFGARLGDDGSDPIVGLNGVTVPYDDFVAGNGHAQVTPDSDEDGIQDGASIQQTVDALLDIGAVVIGLGSGDRNRPPLESLALLTGAINGTTESIPSGIDGDPIDPGDPFYFKITTQVPRIVEALEAAILAAVTQTRYDIDVIASDPNVTITNLTGIAPQAGPGETVSFDVEFTGESLPRRFDLQFVVAGTTSVLGSIPVEISTILAEPGAHVVTLAPGESAADLDFGNFGSEGGSDGIVAALLFYNNSAFDGSDPSINAADSQAIASDKRPLRQGESASFDHYTSYVHGINGLMIDLARTGSEPVSASDFEFRIGNVDNTGSWGGAPDSKDVALFVGAGVNGSDRITIIWNDGAIRGQWLEVTVLSTTATELTSPDVFYFGNAPGETGRSSSDALVEAADFVATRANPSSFLAPAVIIDPYDHNRDRRVNATDLAIVRDYVTSAATALRLINLSSPLAAKSLTGESEAAVIDRLPKKRSAARTVADRQTLGSLITPSASDHEKAELIDRALASWSGSSDDPLETETVAVSDRPTHEALDEFFELD